jgi:hypothetical protein
MRGGGRAMCEKHEDVRLLSGSHSATRQMSNYYDQEPSCESTIILLPGAA